MAFEFENAVLFLLLFIYCIKRTLVGSIIYCLCRNNEQMCAINILLRLFDVSIENFCQSFSKKNKASFCTCDVNYCNSSNLSCLCA